MSKKDIRLKDKQGNYLFPMSHKDDDGNVIKTTYLKVAYNYQIVKDVALVYAYSNDPLIAPPDAYFAEDPAESSEGGYYLWQTLRTTYLNNTTKLGKKINITTTFNRARSFEEI